ncbi:MAG: hypothetical protein IPM82_26945 [Saprospiraceae bacterium]|nr:hypothetical protein [Saprospiraceae bacterium]
MYKDYKIPLAINGATLPLALVKILNGHNVASYSNGFFSFINKSDVDFAFDLWSIPAQNTFPILKTAFGMIVFYETNELKLLDPIYNEIVILGTENDVDFLFNTVLCDRIILENTFLMGIYEAVIPK